MPTFTMSAHSLAPVEEVWKLLHDPRRFPEWWEGIETVRNLPAAQSGGDQVIDYTLWLEGYPDYPMDQQLRTGPGVVTVSCLVSDLHYTWRLAEGPLAAGTDINVVVEVPEREVHRLETQRVVMSRSLEHLALLAAVG